jgi:hypothetical protein
MLLAICAFLGASVGILVGFIPGFGIEILFIMMPGLGLGPANLEWLVALIAFGAFMQTSKLISMWVNPLARFDQLYLSDSFRVKKAEELGKGLVDSLDHYRQGLVLGTGVGIAIAVAPPFLYEFPLILTLSILGVPLLWWSYVQRVERKFENATMIVISAAVGILFSRSGLNMAFFFVAFFNAPLALLQVLSPFHKTHRPVKEEPRGRVLIGVLLSNYLMGWPTSVFGRIVHGNTEAHPSEAGLVMGFEFPVMLGTFLGGGLSRGDISEAIQMPRLDSPLLSASLVGLGILLLTLSLQLAPRITAMAIGFNLNVPWVGIIPVIGVSALAFNNSPQGFVILFSLGMGYHIAARILGIERETSLACISWLPILKNLGL